MSICTFLDVETTGCRASDKVISLGAVVFRMSGNVVDDYHPLLLYNEVSMPISAGAIQVHGITPSLLKQASGGTRYDEYIPYVKQLITGSDFIGGFNTNFDVGMIRNTYLLPPVHPSRILDARASWLRYLKDTTGSKQHGRGRLEEIVPLMLPTCEADFKRDIPDYSGLSYHNALYDAYAAAKLYFKLEGILWK